MPLMIHTIPRSELPVNGVMTFEADGLTCLIADVEGNVEAFSVRGRSSGHLDRAAIADGRVLCALHGWPIDTADGGCGVGALCRYDRLAVEADDLDIRVSLSGP
jgi:nitrite reductase/ring-hydroxylating ferredoxin subunit